MTVLKDYRQFEGIHWDTGTLHNILAYQGVKGPHSGQPLSEALLFGVSGGIVAGYFTFDFAGYAPTAPFMTRYTFEPMQVIFERLGIKTTSKQTDKPEKGIANLNDTLASGKPALVWVDLYGMPYNNRTSTVDMWAMLPVVVYGFDEQTVQIADRARVALTTTADELAAARARTKSNKHRLMTLDNPDLSRLAAAVKAGIETCIASFSGDAPRAQLKGKFGLHAYTKWAELLVDTKNKQGWANHFAPGPDMYSGLKTAFEAVHLSGNGDSGSRGYYAEFLDEASAILGKPALRQVAQQYRQAAALWSSLGAALLPDDVPLLKETRELLVGSDRLFREQGAASLPQRREISARLDALSAEAQTNFPLDESQAADLRASLREHVLKIHDVEREAVAVLKDAVH